MNMGFKKARVEDLGPGKKSGIFLGWPINTKLDYLFLGWPINTNYLILLFVIQSYFLN